MDPFLDLIQLLRPRATLWAKIEGSGSWGLSFRPRNDLLFCFVERGRCELVRPRSTPLSLQVNDFILIRTSTAFSLLSDVNAKATASESAIAKSGSDATLGEGGRPSTVLRGGRFVLDAANADLLTNLLPPLVHITGTGECSERIRTLLEMNRAEASAGRPGSNFVVARLMELLLVEVLRTRPASSNGVETGMLAGLADPVIARALKAMHGDVAHSWTTAKLAKRCATSRSALTARFSKTLGLGPIEYLQQWRIALAKDELRRGTKTIAEIALAIGFLSGSAFSTAFTRAVGCSPRSFVSRDDPGLSGPDQAKAES